MEELLTADQVLVELKISRSTLDRLLATGQLQAQRIGENGSLRFKRGDLQGCLHPYGQAPGRSATTRGSMPSRGMFKRG
jgi:hypothetical protein